MGDAIVHVEPLFVVAVLDVSGAAKGRESGEGAVSDLPYREVRAARQGDVSAAQVHGHRTATGCGGGVIGIANAGTEVDLPSIGGLAAVREVHDDSRVATKAVVVAARLVDVAGVVVAGNVQIVGAELFVDRQRERSEHSLVYEIGRARPVVSVAAVYGRDRVGADAERACGVARLGAGQVHGATKVDAVVLELDCAGCPGGDGCSERHRLPGDGRVVR